MAYLLRLTLALLLAFVAGSAVAAIPLVERWSGTGTYGPMPNHIESTPQAVCAAIAADHNSNPAEWGGTANAPFSGSITSQTSTTANCGIYNKNGFWHTRQITKLANGCPANSTLSGGACQCNAGFVEDETGSACVLPPPPCEALAGKSAGSRTWRGTGSSFSFCDLYQEVGAGKCIATAYSDIGWTDPDGATYRQGSATYTGGTGSTCDGAGGTAENPAGSSPVGSDGQPPVTPDEGTAAPSPCPTGQAPGEVNGQRVCAPIGSDAPTTAPSPQSGTETKTNPDGSSTTKETSGTTQCAGGKCTTTNTVITTTKDASGNVTGTETETTSSTESRATFCQANGKSAQCAGEGDGNGGSFGGDCVAGFKAESDDAVIAAMALEQHNRNCELLRKDGEASQWLEGEGARTDDRTGDNPHNDTVDVGPSNFDTSDALGGGGCALNKTISVRGLSVELPFNMLCDPLAVLGQLLVAVSLLLAARIVIRG